MNEDEILQGLSDDDRAFLLSAKRMYEHADATRAPQFRNTGTSFEEAGSAVVGAIPNLLKSMVVDTAESVRRVGSDIASGVSAALGKGEAKRESGINDLVTAIEIFVPVSAGRKVAKIPAAAFSRGSKVTERGVKYSMPDVVYYTMGDYGMDASDEVMQAIATRRNLMLKNLKKYEGVINERAAAGGFDNWYAQQQIRGIEETPLAVTNIADPRDLDEFADKVHRYSMATNDNSDRDFLIDSHVDKLQTIRGSLYKSRRDSPFNVAEVRANNSTIDPAVDLTTHELTHAAQYNNLVDSGELITEDDFINRIRSIGRQYHRFANDTGISKDMYPYAAFGKHEKGQYLRAPEEIHARINELRYGLDPENPYRQFSVSEITDLLNTVKPHARNHFELNAAHTAGLLPQGAKGASEILLGMNQVPLIAGPDALPKLSRDEMIDRLTRLANLLPSAAAGTAATATLWNSEVQR